jgi:hypothetical protein
LCLLRQRHTACFAEDLEDVFPHVPIPARLRVFQDAVRIGREIRFVEAFSRAPGDAYVQPSFIRLETQPRGAVAAVEYESGSIVLCAGGSGRITGLPSPVWDFSVSGYRVLPRWLEARIGLPADLAFVRELRDICGRIAELIDLFAEADTVLEATPGDTLTREALGFESAGREADDRTG